MSNTNFSLALSHATNIFHESLALIPGAVDAGLVFLQYTSTVVGRLIQLGNGMEIEIVADGNGQVVVTLLSIDSTNELQKAVLTTVSVKAAAALVAGMAS